MIRHGRTPPIPSPRLSTHGIQVKMVTGDNLAIAREIAGQLGLGKIIYAADKLLKTGKEKGEMATDTAQQVEQARRLCPGLP